MIAKALGYLNVFLILIMFSIYPLRKIYMKIKNKNILKISKLLRKLHPILGICVIFIAIIHAYLMLGRFVFHSGVVVLCIILIMGIVQILGKKIPSFKKHWMLVHRSLAVPLFSALAFHIFA